MNLRYSKARNNFQSAWETDQWIQVLVLVSRFFRMNFGIMFMMEGCWNMISSMVLF